MTRAGRQPAKGNLPVLTTSFVGRRRELADIRRLLTETQLLTLMGTGGVGKTRLAMRLALDIVRAFPDGVWFVELADLQTPALLPHAVARALGFRDSSAEWTVQTLATQLEDRTLLLVLDNCEHVIEETADFVGTLLSLSNLRIVATSREALKVPGEFALTILPLSAPRADLPAGADSLHYEAVQLFMDRALARCPDFEVDEQSRSEVAAICRRLEGIPLAIELAADRVRALSLRQISDKLESRLDLLTKGSRGVPRRQQTLRASLEWSWDLCTEPEREFWARLSVFAGGFELDAAEMVCSTPRLATATPVDLIEGLLDKSILFRDDRDSRIRFRMLETVREYGCERLIEAGHRTEVQLRHRDWFRDSAVRAADQWAGQNQVEWLCRCRHEHANLSDALAYSLVGPPEDASALNISTALHWYWYSRGLLSEGRHWLGAALALPAGTASERADALRVSSFLALMQGDVSYAELLISQGRSLAQSISDPGAQASLDVIDGLRCLLNDRYSDAAKYLSDAIPVLHDGADLSGELYALWLDGVVAVMTGDMTQAKTRFAYVLELATPSGELWCRSYATMFLAVVKWVDGDEVGATTSAGEALEMKVAFGEHLGMALCFEIFAWIAESRSDWQRATILLGAADAVWCDTGSRLDIFVGLNVFHANCEQHLSDKLPQSVLESLRRRGADMSRSEAVSYALGETNAPTVEAEADYSPLTRREWQIAENVAEGSSNRQIAAKLVISPRTVGGHIENILAKLAFKSRAEIAAWVTERRSQHSADRDRFG